jgi:hypothetical protein
MHAMGAGPSDHMICGAFHSCYWELALDLQTSFCSLLFCSLCSTLQGTWGLWQPVQYNGFAYRQMEIQSELGICGPGFVKSTNLLSA